MKEAITIKIEGRDFVIKRSFRALMLFEEMTGRMVDNIHENVTDVMKLFYCFLKGGNKDFEYSYDEFIDLVDNNEGIFEDFSQYLQDMAKANTKGEAPAKKKTVKG
jgi:hypothetical protein